MDRRQDRPEHLLGQEQVAEVRPAESAARQAVATLLDRPGVAAMCGVAELDAPWSVKQVALRPFRVGRTQSNRSIPVATASRMSCGRPTPIRYRGRSAGRRCVVTASAWRTSLPSFADADAADRVAVEFHARSGPRRTRRGGRRGFPPGRSRRAPDRSATWASLHRLAQRIVRPTASAIAAFVAGSAGQWSRHMATSAPSASWIAMARSGVSSSSRPSMCDRKATPDVGDLDRGPPG